MRYTTETDSERRQAGYNLVEVLIAMALLSVVLVAIMTLFVLARRNVYSGKQMTRANTVAVRVLEDLSYMTSDEILSNFGLSGNPTLESETIAGVTYSNCAIMKTTDSTPPEYLTRWAALVTAEKMTNGYVALAITPVEGTTGSEFTTADFLRVSVIVGWNEARRARSVVVTATKAQR